VEHWGENQPTVSASGRLAGFYALDTNVSGAGSPGNGPGLTRAARNFSKAYENFLSLYFIYKNNGAIYIPEEFTENATRQVLAMLGSVYIYYDNTLYIGSFSSLNVQESDDKPYGLQYDFEFSVRAKWLLDRQTDPKLTYGNTAIFAKDSGEIPSSSVEFNPADPTVSAEDEVKIPVPEAAEARYQKARLDSQNLSPEELANYRGPTMMDSEETHQAFVETYMMESTSGVIAPPIVEGMTSSEAASQLGFGGKKSNRPVPVDPSVSAAIDTNQSRARRARTVSGPSIPFVRTPK
jgi:hypothetical protein